jgi:hypothetical protein
MRDLGELAGQAIGGAPVGLEVIQASQPPVVYRRRQFIDVGTGLPNSPSIHQSLLKPVQVVRRRPYAVPHAGPLPWVSRLAADDDERISSGKPGIIALVLPEPYPPVGEFTLV